MGNFIQQYIWKRIRQQGGISRMLLAVPHDRARKQGGVISRNS